MSSNVKDSPIVKVDFNNLDREGWKSYRPAILVFDKTLFEVSSWQELLKIFYYLAYKTNNGSEFFESITDQNLIIQDNKIQIEKRLGFERRLNIRGEKVFVHSPDDAYSPVKFYKNNYVSCANTVTRQYSLFNDKITMELSVIDNLEVIKYVIATLGLKGIQIYLSCADDKNIVSQAIESQIKKLTQKSNGKKISKKNAKYFLAHINGEILSDEEKFYRYAEKEFDKKILLGDIYLTSEQDELLNSYMFKWLNYLDYMGRPLNDHPKVFALGLVRYAMKYYSQKTFWPYFEDEYGIGVKINNQGVLHSAFQRVMQENKKAYDVDTTMKIDNISMHSFVTDKCADQFFDYLFDFWRLDIKRNVENIYGETGKAYFDVLLDELENNYHSPINKVMKHTSMALIKNKKSCVLRIRRILNMIDDCFWNQTTEIPQTGNRINALLQNWMLKKGGKFQQEYKTVIRKTGTRGETLLSAPTLCTNFYRSDFSIKLPQEILRHCGNGEHPYWVISSDNLPSITREPILYMGSIGKYTEECEVALPQEYLFEKITMTLTSSERQYAKFSFKSTDIRFFNEKGICFDHSKGFIPSGLFIAYSNNPNLPVLLDEENTQIDNAGELYVKQYQLVRGDIMIFPDGHAIPVEKKINEGLMSVEPLSGVIAKDDADNLAVYNSLPKVLFKAKREQIDGTAVIITDITGEQHLFKVSDHRFHEFKLDDSLDDVYAYLIDLREYIFGDGIYTVNINIPHSHALNLYRFAYLKGLSYQFVNAPYVFQDTATIQFANSSKIKKDREWNGDELQFNFDTDSHDCSDKVDGINLNLQYEIKDDLLQLVFPIPALFWKYKKDDKWSHKQPADLSIKNIPSHLYVQGPFNFSNKSTTHLNVDESVSRGFDETDIYAERVKDTDYYSFYLSNIKSWLDYSIEQRSVNITLSGTKYPLCNIICKSSIKKASLSGDYDNNTLHGYFEISGDGEYTVKVKQNGEIIGQDISLENGTFELETDNLGGTYLVTVYEIIEDESGFDDSDSIKIGEYSLEIIDLTNLQNNVICITGFADREKKYRPRELSQEYVIHGLQYAGKHKDVSEWEINGLWNLDFYDPNSMKNCTFYTGTLSHIEGKELIEDFNVLVIFCDRYDLTKIVVLRESEGEYIELLYDILHHELIPNDDGLKFWQKMERILTLADDLYDCVAEIRSEIPFKNRR